MLSEWKFGHARENYSNYNAENYRSKTVNFGILRSLFFYIFLYIFIFYIYIFFDIPTLLELTKRYASAAGSFL